MINNSPFSGFFTNVKADETLLFTTFTLDEAVLAELLKSHNVHKNQRIVVLHDVMKHRNPGYLRSKFPNLMVYSVQLKQTHAKRCPVFHSKIWARIQVDGELQSIRHLVVTSANLSSYHLIQREGGTLESYNYFGGINVPVPVGNSIFSSKFLSASKQLLIGGINRISLNPHSLIIDTRAKCGILISEEPIVDFLKKLGSPNFCAGPFICDPAITKHLSPTDKFKVFDGTNPKTGFALHAKVMSFPDSLALGSVNWTAQALGCLGKRPINHETLLIVKKDSLIEKALKGYPCRELGKEEIKIPGDLDPEDANSGDWLVERELRINAPEKAIFVIYGEDGEGARIDLLGKFVKATKVLVRSAENNEEIVLDVSDKVIYEPFDPESKNKFASILKNGNVELIGQFRGKNVWGTFLDYGDYWTALEAHQIKRGNEGPKTGRTKKAPSVQGDGNSDVRDMRQIVIQDPEKGRTFVVFTRWLARRNQSAVMIPLWCHKLSDRLHERTFQ